MSKASENYTKRYGQLSIMLKKLSLILSVVIFLFGCNTKHENEPSNTLNNENHGKDSIKLSWKSYAAKLDTNVIPDSVYLNTNLISFSFHGMYCGSLSDTNDSYFSCWELKQFPIKVTDLSLLETLDLEGNRISLIPEEILKLKKLKELNLADNPNIKNLSVLSNLDNLEILNLNGCKLSKLPINFSKLKKLEIIGLTRNNFDSTEVKRIKSQLKTCQSFF